MRTELASSMYGFCGERMNCPGRSGSGEGEWCVEQAPGLIEVQEEGAELVADPERAVGRDAERLDVEIGAGEHAVLVNSFTMANLMRWSGSCSWMKLSTSVSPGPPCAVLKFGRIR